MSDASSAKKDAASVSDKVSKRKKLGEMLVDRGLLRPAEVSAAVKRADHDKVPLGTFLISEGLISDFDLAKILAEQMEMEFEDLSRKVVSTDVLKAIRPEVIREHTLLPFARENGVLIVVSPDPQVVMRTDSIRNHIPAPYKLRIGARSQIEKVIDRLYGAPTKQVESIARHLIKHPEGTPAAMNPELSFMQGLVSIDTLLDKMLEMALRNDSSDIHVDPADGFIRLRERMDGVLHETGELEEQIHQSLISKLKVLAGLDITEKRKPQDGRFRYKVSGRLVDVRLSTLPTIRGERAVLRILDKSKFKVRLEDVGINAGMVTEIKRLLHHPHGILLVTGPTGSGKTTTVYSMLSFINEAESNIITVEDPVEYQFDIINQVQIAPKAGLHFADLLRNILRQDPDVIMVGEIRDKETADTAIRAALTGHLVISTIHTNDSVSTVARLTDMGVESFLIASSVLAILSQRLVRLLCYHCKKEVEITEDSLKKLPPGMGNSQWIGKKVFESAGCNECRKTGYRGRTAIAELFVPDDEVRKLITENAPRGQILEYIRKNGGFKTMREESLEKVFSGETSFSEIFRNTI